MGGFSLTDLRKPGDADPFALTPGLQEKAKRWFAEAREQTKRDDEDIASWRRASHSSGDAGSGGADWGDCGGGGDGGGGGD